MDSNRGDDDTDYVGSMQERHCSYGSAKISTPRSASINGLSRFNDYVSSGNDVYDRYKNNQRINGIYASESVRGHHPSFHQPLGEMTRLNSSLTERRLPICPERFRTNNSTTFINETNLKEDLRNKSKNRLCFPEDFQSFRNKNIPAHDYDENWQDNLSPLKNEFRPKTTLINGSLPKSKSFINGYTENRRNSSINSNEHVIQKFRTRSESEPNDIKRLTQSIITNSVDTEAKKVTVGSKNDILRNVENEESIQNTNKVLPLAKSKRDSPPRVLLYKNPNYSPGLTKKNTRFRCSPVLCTPRLNVRRKPKAKSVSPTFGKKSFTLLKPELPSRKLKSVTPPPIHNLSSTEEHIKLGDEIICSSRDSESFKECSDTEESSLGDDDDFTTDLNDDSLPQHSSSDSDNEKRKKNYCVSDIAISPWPYVKKQTENNDNSGGDGISSSKSFFAPSLFPYVPPYLAFCSYTEKGPPISETLHKILKWKLTSVMPRVVRRIIINSGFRLLKKTNDWMGTWGKHMRSPCFKTIRSYQKINHIPGSFKIGRKDCCWRNLQAQMVKFGKDEFGFMPRTYVIPQDLKSLRKAWPRYSQKNFKWIIKPPASARGTGIRVINRWSQIPKRKPVIVQRYIERPLLINGSKFDLRLYVLVTSFNPLRVYLYKDGLARFASVKYSDKPDTLSDRCMHLTNYSINKLSANYARNDDANACQGHKWTIKSLWSYLAERGINTNRLWGSLRNLVLRTLLAGENAIHTVIKMNVESKYNCFELFGFDVLLDSELVPWLLEVNISPSLHSELPLDLHVKGPLVQAVLNTALYNIPPKLTVEQQKEVLLEQNMKAPLCFDKRIYVTYLTRAEKLKHNQFTRKSLEDREDYLNAILENFTPDDLRCLIISEDELARSQPLERIFPGPNTYKYLKYTDSHRYYNRLLDAWENRYAKNRLAGIKYLQEMCEQKYHLEVPATPVRKPLKLRTRTLRKFRTIPAITPLTAVAEAAPPGLTRAMTTRKTVTSGFMGTSSMRVVRYMSVTRTAVNSIKRRNKSRISISLARSKRKRYLTESTTTIATPTTSSTTTTTTVNSTETAEETAALNPKLLSTLVATKNNTDSTISNITTKIPTIQTTTATNGVPILLGPLSPTAIAPPKILIPKTNLDPLNTDLKIVQA